MNVKPKKRGQPYGVQYQRACVAHAVETGAKNAPLNVLKAMLFYINYDNGQARPGKARLQEDLGCCAKTIERALPVLMAMGLIRPVAYLTGGHGRTTVYGFALPAWSTTYHRQFVQIPPTICPNTTDNLSVPTERTERTDDKAGASRPDNHKVGDDRSDQYWRDRLTMLGQTMDYGESRRALEKEKEALRAAENEKGEKINVSN